MTFFATAAASTDALEALYAIAQPALLITPYLPPAPRDQTFIAAEVSYYVPATPELVFAVAVGEMPVGAVTLEPFSVQNYETIYTSDTGYLIPAGSGVTQTLYAPTLSAGWQVDRTARLEPWNTSGSVSWGSVKLINSDQRYDGVADAASPDGRPIRLLRGIKTYDASRGILVDPPYSSLTPVFSGVGGDIWRKNENEIEISIRDAGYLGETALQTSIYAGTGGYNGTADIAGKPIPYCRGGTNSYPIPNVAPVLIDPTNRIWQYNDAPGTVVALYERAASVFTYDGDTTNLYTGSVAAGHYRTDNSRGLFQLGATAAGEITADVTGSFPVAGAQTTAASIARYILSETLSIDAAFLDTGSLIGLNAARPWISGVYVTESVNGMTIVDSLLRSLNAWLYPSKTGLLRAALFQAPGVLNISASYDENKIVKCTPRALPALLSPPPYRIRLAHSKRYTVQNSDWAGAATDARKQFVSEEWSFASWVSSANLVNYRKSNDPPAVETYLLVASEAQQVVEEMGDIVGVRRSLYDLEMPMYLAPRHEIGEQIEVSFPGAISEGTKAVVLGDNIDSNSATFTMTVLI